MQGPVPPPASKSNADWDSMFSGFDNGATKSAGKPAAPQRSFGGFDDGEITPAPMQPPPRTSSAAAPAATRAPAPAPVSKPRPPPVGRALTTTGEHDDPLLKSLTNLGFKRDDALQALERFDYNVDAVS
jgi:epidermal growth factor receptor substrate 15